MVNLKEGFSKDVVLENIETLESVIDRDSAMVVAVSYARACFKRENQTTTVFPKHLQPGKVKQELEA